MKKPSKLLLLGYSGRRNFGDDLLLQQAYDAFNQIIETHIHTSNLSESADYLNTWFPNSVIQKSTKLNYSFIKNYSHVVYFGGGVFFDYKKEVSFKEYWKKRLSVLINYNFPGYQGTGFAGIGIGLGPFLNKKNENIAFKRLSNFQHLNVRDNTSLNLCKKYALKNVTICEDLSLTNYGFYHSFKTDKENRANKIIICPRKFPHGTNGDRYLKNLLLIANKLKAQGKNILVYGFQSYHDEEVVEEFSKQNFETKIWNPDDSKLDDLVKEFSMCELVITARMHGLYISGMLDVPVIGVGVHQKLKFASELFSQSLFLTDDFELNDMEISIQKAKELPGNNLTMLQEKQHQCKQQYEVISKWLKEKS